MDSIVFPSNDDVLSDTDSPSFSYSSDKYPSTSTAPTDLDEFASQGTTMSPAPSIYSLTSSLHDESFTNLHGRLVNSHSEVYKLPADDEEIDRLDTQHQFLKNRIFGGKNWLGPVPEVLRKRRLYQPAILDLGCGTGAWAIDMAKEFPHCEVVGVDLVPIQALDGPLPRNCRVEVDDLNLSMNHHYGCFDMVHARLINSGIRDYYHLIHESTKILRPRGLIFLQEWDFRVYDRNHNPIIPHSEVSHPQHSWLARWVYALSKAVRDRRGNIDSAALLKIWLEGHHGYEDVESKDDVWLPVSPHFPDTPENKVLNINGEMFRQDVKSFIEGGRPLLLSKPMPAAEVALLESNAKAELDAASKPMYLRLWCAWARRKKIVSEGPRGVPLPIPSPKEEAFFEGIENYEEYDDSWEPPPKEDVIQV